jgi:SAM-dependent methyltransferase
VNVAGIAKQSWEAERYAEAGAFVPVLGMPVVELLDPRPGERILDLGCGDGILSEKVAAAGATVVAVDAAPDLIAAAKARGLDARLMDGQTLPFAAEFDAVFSNAALHWMRDADAVIASVKRALKPGGRFVAEMGGTGRLRGQRDRHPAAPDGTDERYRSVARRVLPSLSRRGAGPRSRGGARRDS